MSGLSSKEIRQQSMACYQQWSNQWRRHAKYHGERFEMKPMDDFANTGIGRAALCIANGASFEANIETIKKYQNNVDIVACDKTIGHCLANGIIPKFVILCDANVSYEKYLEPWRSQLKDTILIANVCAATKWATLGNWKDVYFFINKDILKSEIEFIAISNCKNVFVAGTNVSNAMVIALTQCDDTANRNFFGYDKILLIGYDYSWRDRYYSFDHDAGGKINYMRNIMIRNIAGDLCWTSPNLMFSARWIEQYIKAYKLPVIQCTKHSIVQAYKQSDLETQMSNYEYRSEDSEFVRSRVKEISDLSNRIKDLKSKIWSIQYDHHLSFLRTV